MGITVCTTADVRTEVDVDVEIEIEDIADSLTKADVEKLLKRLSERKPALLVGGDNGDPNMDRWIEAAFYRARQMPDCPREFIDLLWHVHRRALA